MSTVKQTCAADPIRGASVQGAACPSDTRHHSKSSECELVPLPTASKWSSRSFFLASWHVGKVQCKEMGIRGIYNFYRDGFQRMTLGRTLWCVILVKLVIIFVVLRVFFFAPHLRGTDEQKSRAVAEELTNRH